MNETKRSKLLKEKEEELQNLRQEAEQWQYIKDHGCQDPFWPDGVNMNLIRNHIIYGKKVLLQICEELNENMPEEYYSIQTPPETDPEYMCRDGEYFKKRRQDAIDRGETISTRKPKAGTPGQTELF